MEPGLRARLRRVRVPQTDVTDATADAGASVRDRTDAGERWLHPGRRSEPRGSPRAQGEPGLSIHLGMSDLGGTPNHTTGGIDRRPPLPSGRTVDGMTEEAVRTLAGEIALHGFSVEKSAQAALWAGARRRGVDPLLVSVAADPTERTVVRFRALAAVVSRYCALVSDPVEVDLVPAIATTAISGPTIAAPVRPVAV